MIRSLLQFIGFASTGVFSLLLVGSMLVSSTHAAIAPFDSSPCGDCYGCSATTACSYSTGPRNCNGDNNKCNCSQSGKYYSCSAAAQS